jgi:putative FmdB family regulatory protein
MKGDRVPTYQYACTECGEQLEMVQRFSDDPLSVCPACSGRLRKVFSPVGIVFKGSGFYRTDSRAGNGAKDGAKDGRDVKDGKTTEAASSGANSGGSGDKSDKGEKKAAATTSSSKESSSGAPSPASSSGSTSEKVA